VTVEQPASGRGSALARVLGEARAGLSMYFLLLRAQAAAQMQYRVSFAVQVVSQFVTNLIGLLVIVLLFQRFPSLAGWSLAEVMLLYGLANLSFGLSDLLCGGFDGLSKMIKMGTFDRVLTRPVGTFAQVLASDVQIRRLGRVAQGVFGLWLAVSWLDIAWTLPKVLVLASAIVSGTVVFAAIWVIGAAITFWTVETSEVTNVFTYGGQELVEYPLPIYADGVQKFFTYVVPLAFVTYLPALFILDRLDPLGLPQVLQLASPLVAILFFLVARGCWALGVRHYQGTGS
jgi:ABC-2 type transport system permease protein